MLGRRCIELIGPGDVMRPWSWDDAGSHVRAEVGWEVLEPTQAGRARPRARHPHQPVAAARASSCSTAGRGARTTSRWRWRSRITTRVEDRLLLTLWHLAERWGKVTPEGILVPLPLSHQRLADIVGAHRPSVTTAMGALSKAGTRQPPRRRRLAPARRPAREAPPPPAGGGAAPRAATVFTVVVVDQCSTAARRTRARCARSRAGSRACRPARAPGRRGRRRGGRGPSTCRPCRRRGRTRRPARRTKSPAETSSHGLESWTARCFWASHVAACSDSLTPPSNWRIAPM